MNSGNLERLRRLSIEFGVGVLVGSLLVIGSAISFLTGTGGRVGAMACASFGLACVTLSATRLRRLLMLSAGTPGSSRASHVAPVTRATAAIRPAPRHGSPERHLARLQELLPAATSDLEQETILANIGEAVLVTDETGVITHSNQAASDLLGWSIRELYSRSLMSLIETDQGNVLPLEALTHQQRDVTLRSKNGDRTPVSVTGSPLLDQRGTSQASTTMLASRTRYAFIARDISEKDQQERRISYLARYDSLTKLPNRISFQQLLQRAIERAHRNDQQLAMLYFDLDRFKDINDTFGHPAGDRALQILSERLLQILPAGTVLGRLAGDEFGAFIEGLADVDSTMILNQLSRQLLDEVSRPFFMADTEIYLTMSIGIGCYPSDGESAVEMVRNSDAAMYHAKQSGGGGYAFYSSGMNAEAVERLVLKSRLRRALQNDEFSIVYQPKVDLRIGRVVGAEALLRWRLPGRGDIPPAQFIPLAEATGLIVPIGSWVLRQVCKDYQAWLTTGHAPDRVSANVSLKELEHPDFASRCAATLDEFGISGSHLELEITESTLMANAERTLATLSELHALGISISIDDFGTGYSSLSTLQQLPVEQLKIDQSFIVNVTRKPSAALLVRTMIEMARNLGLEVVAEGVETRAQAEFLRDKGCHYAQGDWSGQAIGAAELSLVLKASGRRFEVPALAQQLGFPLL